MTMLLLLCSICPSKSIYGSNVHSSKAFAGACNVCAVKSNRGGNICSGKLASSS